MDPFAPVILANPTLKGYFLESDQGTEVAYHLAKNPAALFDLAAMSPVAAMRELTRLEARLAAPPPPKPVTKAPDPITPVGGRETAAHSLADLAERDTAAYVARRRKQMAGGT